MSVWLGHRDLVVSVRIMLERISERITLWLMCKRIDFRAKHPEVPFAPMDLERLAALRQKYPDCKKLWFGGRK